MSITVAQIRGARGLLNWSQSALSKRTNISTTSIGNIEAGNTQARETTLKLIRQAFENAGIEFIGTEGIRMRNDIIRIFEGREGFWEFYEDIYNTVRKDPGEVLVSNVDERDFERWLDSDNLRTHVSRMEEIDGLTYKILIREGDTHYLTTSDYCVYRWLPKQLFVSVPFYVYGNKMAIVLFNEQPKVILLNNAMITEGYRKQFQAIWDISITPLKVEKAG